MPRGLTFFTVLALGLAAFVLLPMPGRTGNLERREDVLKAKIGERKRREGVLTTDISSYNARIRAVQGRIRGLQQRQNRLGAALAELQARRQRIADQLERARDRVARLRGELARSERVLAKRLVEMYKRPEPDLLTVVLEADGFTDLLDRAAFLERITRQDNAIIARVRGLKQRWTREAGDLKELEASAAAAVKTVAERRDEVVAVKGKLVSARSELQGTRDGREALLVRVRQSRRALEGDLRAVQAQVRARLRAAQRTAFTAPTGAAGPIRRGSGSLIWPVNGTIASPFGQRWGRLHAGIDIPAPGGTPIRAADSGRVVLVGWTGGYGNYTCLQHTATMSTCYAHQSSIGVSAGQSVSQGNVIGAVGNTGHSFGNHLHFEVRVNGSPVDPLGYL